MEQDNQILVDSKAFAIRVVRLYPYLSDKKNEHVMSKQILRSGTSIGANCHESRFAQSKVDFINKMSIALKEAMRLNTGWNYCMKRAILMTPNIILSMQMEVSCWECWSK